MKVRFITDEMFPVFTAIPLRDQSGPPAAPRATPSLVHLAPLKPIEVSEAKFQEWEKAHTAFITANAEMKDLAGWED